MPKIVPHLLKKTLPISMAFNWQTFKTRTLTALVFGVIMVIGLFWNRWSYFLLFSIIHFGCWVEYQRLITKYDTDYNKITTYHRYGIMLAGWCLMLYFTNGELHLGSINLSEAGLWFGVSALFILPVLILIPIKKFFINNIGYSLFGLIYISLSLGLIIYLRNYWSESDYRLSMTVPLLLVFALWVNDTLAYLVGSAIGKTPFSPVSPKKTWEGTIGGALLAIVIMCGVAFATQRLSIFHTAIITLLAVTGGTLGDLFQSRLKRMAGVKDSGNIMPGHGGFLDRFDSLLFAAFFCWTYAVLFL